MEERWSTEYTMYQYPETLEKILKRKKEEEPPTNMEPATVTVGTMQLSQAMLRPTVSSMLSNDCLEIPGQLTIGSVGRIPSPAGGVLRKK